MKIIAWSLVVIALVGWGIFLVMGQGKSAKPAIQVSAIVEKPVVLGQFERMELHSPRKNMPTTMFTEDLKQTSSLRNLRGQWTLVNLWASWCPPCLRELPSLQRLNDVYVDQGFRVVAISLDTAGAANEIDSIVSTRRLGRIARNWDHTGELLDLVMRTGALPVSFIVDPEGKVFAQLNGEANWSTPEALALVDSLLGRNVATAPLIGKWQ